MGKLIKELGGAFAEADAPFDGWLPLWRPIGPPLSPPISPARPLLTLSILILLHISFLLSSLD